MPVLRVPHLSAWRRRAGLGQAELARRAGVSYSTIESLESTEKPTRARHATRARLAAALGWRRTTCSIRRRIGTRNRDRADGPVRSPTSTTTGPRGSPMPTPASTALCGSPTGGAISNPSPRRSSRPCRCRARCGHRAYEEDKDRFVRDFARRLRGNGVDAWLNLSRRSDGAARLVTATPCWHAASALRPAIPVRSAIPRICQRGGRHACF